MLITTKQLIKWLKPWPIQIKMPHAKWQVTLTTASKLRKYKYFNKRSNGKRFSIGTVVKHIQEDKAQYLGGYHHHCLSAMRSKLRPVAVICARGLIIDGNHSLISCLLNRDSTPFLKVELVEEK